jgi:hypothetical protein
MISQLLTVDNQQLSTFKDKRAILFVNTSFGTNVQVYLILLPLLRDFERRAALVAVLSCLGDYASSSAHQIPFFQSTQRFAGHFFPTMRLLVSAIWVEREQLERFLNEAATAWSQLLALLLFWDYLRT